MAKREWQVKLCDPSLTLAILDHHQEESLVTKCYINLHVLYIT